MAKNRQVVYTDTLQKILDDFIYPAIEDAVEKRIKRIEVGILGDVKCEKPDEYTMKMLYRDFLKLAITLQITKETDRLEGMIRTMARSFKGMRKRVKKLEEKDDNPGR